MTDEEGAPLAPAMLAGVAIHVYRDLDEAAEKLVKKVKTYEPRESYHQKYLAVFARYEKLYQAVRGLME